MAAATFAGVEEKFGLHLPKFRTSVSSVPTVRPPAPAAPAQAS